MRHGHAGLYARGARQRWHQRQPHAFGGCLDQQRAATRAVAARTSLGAIAARVSGMPSVTSTMTDGPVTMLWLKSFGNLVGGDGPLGVRERKGCDIKATRVRPIYETERWFECTVATTYSRVPAYASLARSMLSDLLRELQTP